jgi:hypothetical protein
MSVPHIAPAKGMRSFEFEQSKYKHLDKVLPCRLLAIGASNSGKGIAVQSLILDVFRLKWKRIYYFSKTALVDHTLEPIEKYVRQVLKVPIEEEWRFSEWDPAVVKGIIDQQKSIIEYEKKHNFKTLHGILIVCDDFAGDFQIMRGKQGEALKDLFLMGRHYGISTIVTLQKYRLASTILRTNATFLMYFAARSMVDLDAFLEENSALAPGGKKQLMEIYKKATSEEFGFLAINMMSKDTSKIFMKSLHSYLVPQ